jgi:hypothetical protein
MFTEVELEECSCVPETEDLCNSCAAIDAGLIAAEADREAYAASLSPAKKVFRDSEAAVRAWRVKYLREHLWTDGSYKSRYVSTIPDPYLGQPGDVETDDSDIEIPLTLESEMAIDEWIQNHDGEFPVIADLLEEE